MARDTLDWLRVLCEMGVAIPVAEKAAPVFAAEIGDNTFSKGDAEVPVFLAHLLHESGMLERTQENLNYSAGRITELGMASPKGSRWRSLVPKAMSIARNPRAFAEAVYGGRMGNDEPGDGWKYRGRGWMQITGKANYRRLAEIMGVDLVANPDLLLDPVWSLRAAIAFWEHAVADETIDTDDVSDDTYDVNGGQNGLKHRQQLADLAVKVLA